MITYCGMITYCLVTAVMVWIMNGDSEKRSVREGDGTMRKNGGQKLKKRWWIEVEKKYR